MTKIRKSPGTYISISDDALNDSINLAGSSTSAAPGTICDADFSNPNCEVEDEDNVDKDTSTSSPALSGTVSYSKLTTIDKLTSPKQNPHKSSKPTGDRIIDMDIVGNIFEIVAYPECCNVGLNFTQENKQGAAFQ